MAPVKSAHKTVSGTRVTKTNAPDLVELQLERYRAMRNFTVTAEPAGKTKNTKLAQLPFCIQKHAASHLHYDFRLGWNGVLKSWACAKGPSYNVKDRRLAVQVEDHPIEYGGFEGMIPAGQYGGGTVMLWDQGTWQPQPEHPDVEAGLRDGHLKFLMHGTKMKGKWALIRMAARPKETRPNWLLIKEHDEFEQPPEAPSITESEPNSVITGRSLEQIGKDEDHLWSSNRPEKRSTVSPEDRPKLLFETDKVFANLPKEQQSSFLKPQLAMETHSPPTGPGWIHELKLDGYRMQARKDGAKVILLTRSGLDWTGRMGEIAVEVGRLPVNSATLDGEVVVLSADGTTNFADLQAAFQANRRNPLTYFAFDLLHLDGRNLRGLPLIERKKLLAKVLEDADPQLLQFSEHLVSNGDVMFRKACELHAEGIVSKRANAPYSGTRNAAWLKSKCMHVQEFVIGGYTLPGKGKAGGPGIGALLLGYYDEDGENLTYAGRSGTGFTQKVASELRKQLEELKSDKCPFISASAAMRKGAIWVKPELVAQVRFATWTADQLVRQAAFTGIREDKAPAEVRREISAPIPKAQKSVAARSHAHRDPSVAEHPPVRLTHPQKILDNETKVTKQQLADFYWAVAARMLPHIADRPLSLVRCPEGSEKPCFFQKHVTAMLPPGVGSVDIADKKGVVEPYITLNTPEALAGLAQMGVLEIHPWGSHNATLEQPDRITIDLDPDEALPWSSVTAAALEVRKRMKTLGLESWVKTTGGKGLHIVVPFTPRQRWPATKEWTHRFVLAMERDYPSLYLTRMNKAARTGRIYLDYLRNERGATAVAPYSPRARKGTPVSVPLAWSELNAATCPDFRIANFPDWEARLSNDVWADMLNSMQQLKPSEA